jgi:hypothetical protein
VAGQIAVGAYVTEAAYYKLTRYGCGLVGAVFQEQPAATLEVLRCRMDNLAQRGHSVRTGGKRDLRLMPQSCVL